MCHIYNLWYDVESRWQINSIDPENEKHAKIVRFLSLFHPLTLCSSFSPSVCVPKCWPNIEIKMHYVSSSSQSRTKHFFFIKRWSVHRDDDWTNRSKLHLWTNYQFSYIYFFPSHSLIKLLFYFASLFMHTAQNHFAFLPIFIQITFFNH